MALIRCSECGSEISDKASACVKCGAPLIKSTSERELFNGRSNSGPCENCKRLLSVGCKKCPDCGAEFSGDSWQPPPSEPKAKSPAFDRPNTPPPTATASHPTKPSTNLWMWIVGVPLGLFVALVLSSAMGNKGGSQTGTKESARDVIKLCWEDQQRKSYEPSTQRFVASVCEKMEEDFRKKFNLSP